MNSVERAGNAVEIEVQPSTIAQAKVVTGDGMTLPLAPGAGAPEGSRVHYGVRPEHWSLTEADAGIPVNVNVVEPTGAEILVVCQLADREIQASFHERHDFTPGQRINLQPNLDVVHLFERERGTRMS